MVHLRETVCCWNVSRHYFGRYEWLEIMRRPYTEQNRCLQCLWIQPMKVLDGRVNMFSFLSTSTPMAYSMIIIFENECFLFASGWFRIPLTQWSYMMRRVENSHLKTSYWRINDPFCVLFRIPCDSTGNKTCLAGWRVEITFYPMTLQTTLWSIKLEKSTYVRFGIPFQSNQLFRFRVDLFSVYFLCHW